MTHFKFNRFFNASQTVYKKSRTNTFLLLLTICCLAMSACGEDDAVVDPEPELTFPKEVTVVFENLKPEGIEYNKNNNTFLLGSLTMGDVQEVDFEGNYTNFTKDEALQASAGIHIDYDGDRLLVTNLDPGAFGGAKSVAALNIYKLSTQEKIDQVSFLELLPDADFFTPNDIAVDAAGNVYVTDFLGHVIYKVDQNYEASVFADSSMMLVGPNGIDFHPDGYLLVSNLLGGQLLKMPVDNPDEVSVVTIDDERFSGMDGVVYRADGKLVGITSFETLVELSSTDNWATAAVDNSKALSTPGTTVAVTPEGHHYALLTDVVNPEVFTDWVIELVEF